MPSSTELATEIEKLSLSDGDTSGDQSLSETDGGVLLPPVTDDLRRWERLNATAASFRPAATASDEVDAGDEGDVATRIVARAFSDKTMSKKRSKKASVPTTKSDSKRSVSTNLPFRGGIPQELEPMKQPTPTQAYLRQATNEPFPLDEPLPLLVILDLNGTLLHRKRKGDTKFTSRPKVREFLHYLFKNHHVMVWSSAMPNNVRVICNKLLTKEQNERLVACWGRDKLRLPPDAYQVKVQVYKQLSWVWQDVGVQLKNPDNVDYWSQENTVLIDDSKLKASSEPYNLLQIEEFQNRKDQARSDVLGQVVKYLEPLRAQNDVSCYMRKKPFQYDVEDGFNWRYILEDMPKKSRTLAEIESRDFDLAS